MNLLNQLSKSEKLAKGGKLNRFINKPYKYFRAHYINKISYPINQKSKLVKTPIFTNDIMHLLIPAGLDIYLTGIKSHCSEIRLCKYFIQNLKKGNTFIDIGAHFGFYSLLAAKLVGASGKVFSFEAAKSIYSVLSKNINNKPNVHPFNNAISNQKGNINFYEFPIQYSEYNSIDIEQYKKFNWFKKQIPTLSIIESTNLDNFTTQQNCAPQFIKIDVEGAEKLVIEGAVNCIKNHQPIIAMEFLLDQRGNQNHIEAAQTILKSNYTINKIADNGNLIPTTLIELLNSATKSAQSDNLIFAPI